MIRFSEDAEAVIDGWVTALCSSLDRMAQSLSQEKAPRLIYDDQEITTLLIQLQLLAKDPSRQSFHDVVFTAKHAIKVIRSLTGKVDDVRAV